MVYSAAKYNHSLPLTWARNPEVGLPRPDRVIFLDLSAEEAEKRGGFGEEKYEKKQFQQEVRKQFLDLRFCGGDEEEDTRVVDAGSSIEEVEDRIWKEVEEVVSTIVDGNEPLRAVGSWEGADETLRRYGSFEAAR